MNLLAIESSCDETAAAVVRDGRTVLSDVIASQADMHAVYGGVVPEIASRKHVEAIAGLAREALARAGIDRSQVDGVAVTYAPGLIGAVLVGVSFAKAAAFALQKPLIPVHHVRGHISANYIAHPDLAPPFICLCVSGGTTLIVDVRDYTSKIYDLMIIDSSTHVPPLLKIEWSSLQFEGHLVNCSQKFTMFNQLGTPVRATLDVTFKQYMKPSKIAKMKPNESPDTEKSTGVPSISGDCATASPVS